MNRQEQPKITVLLTVFNGEQYLSEAIDSILCQTFNDFEFIIINDGSSDKSAEIAERYAQKDSRIILIHQKNEGLTKSLNKGLSLAKGEYIARMDADDISEPERLQVQAQFLDQNQDVGVVGIDGLVIDEEGHEVGKVGHPVLHNEITALLLLDNRFTHSSVMFRAKLSHLYGVYDETLIMAQDYDLWLRFFMYTKMANIPRPLHKWRANITSGISINKRDEQIVFRDKVRQNFLEKHFSKSGDHINLILSNLRNCPTDRVLLAHLKRVYLSLSLVHRLYLRLKVFIFFRQEALLKVISH